VFILRGESVSQTHEAMQSFDIDVEQQRTLKVIDGFKTSLPAQLIPCVEKTRVCLSWSVVYAEVAFPYALAAGKWCVHFWSMLPHNVILCMLGVFLCFFGGMYPTLMAAGEAIRICGWDRTADSCKALLGEAKLILEESKKDDLRDDDGDGIADIDQLDAKALVKRKTRLVLLKCHPNEINVALSGLFISWLGVVGVLKAKFAKTIALAVTIGDLVKKPFTLLLAPLAAHIIPEEYKHWIPIIIGWLAKSLGIAVAWYIERVLSAVHSAARGGLMFSRAFLAFADGQGWTLGGQIKPNPEDTYIDEVIGWSVAAVGVLWQFSVNFAPPFPLNLVFFPVTIGEYMLQWHITQA